MERRRSPKVSETATQGEGCLEARDILLTAFRR